MQIKKDERNEKKAHHIQDTVVSITSYLQSHIIVRILSRQITAPFDNSF